MILKHLKVIRSSDPRVRRKYLNVFMSKKWHDAKILDIESNYVTTAD